MCMKAPRPSAEKRKTSKPSQAAIVRAVASSTAIETGQPIARIERKLQVKHGKYRDLSLAH